MWAELFKKIKTETAIPQSKLDEIEQFVINSKMDESEKAKFMMIIFISYAAGLSAGLKHNQQQDND